jgi:hypothetical protein
MSHTIQNIKKNRIELIGYVIFIQRSLYEYIPVANPSKNFKSSK